MEITLLDKSNYLRGLLLLLGKDKKITEVEKELFIKLSMDLGFAQDFVEKALEELLENEFIISEPPRFSNIEIAKLFLLDGIKLAFADKELHIYELSWLKSVAEKNSINAEWGIEQFEKFKYSADNRKEFEIVNYLRSKKK